MMTARPSVQRMIITLLLLIAVLERFGWAVKRGWDGQAGEATNVAVAIATGRGFADPYSFPSGPTAHLMPTTPVIAGAAYRLLGVRSLAAEVALQIVASAEMIIGYLLLFALFGRLGSSFPARLLALTIMCLIPVFMGQESLDFRYWEGGLAVLLMTASLIQVLDLEKQTQQPSYQQILMTSLLFALTFFTSPQLGIGVGVCCLIVLIRKGDWRHRLGMAGIAVAALCLVLAPWVIRNDIVMGKPILLRSNAGLELAIANNDHQVSMPHKLAFTESMAAIHPMSSSDARSSIKSKGEVKFMNTLSTSTTLWIENHPIQFAQLCARHLRQMFIPDAYQFEIGSGAYSDMRATLYSFIGVCGLIGIAFAILRKQYGYIYVAVIVATVALTYLPFQPMARYLYLSYGLLTFCATYLIISLLSLADRANKGVRHVRAAQQYGHYKDRSQ